VTAASVGCVLWDFGDTIADQGWMRVCPPGVPQWAEGYSRVIDRLGEAWDRGELTMGELVDAVATELTIDSELVLAHMHARCRAVEFYPPVIESLRLRRGPQALVTLNPDVFLDLVVPHYKLDQYFDLMVISSQEHTNDKATLSAIATERLGFEVGTGRALLIDNVEANVRAWQQLGEPGYWFRGPATFEQDLHRGLLPAILRP
jgi:FMN phosphatase YigB (HAD superfamily)